MLVDPGLELSQVLTIGAAMVSAGLIGGYLAGLLGVGGGIVIVPVLYQVLDFMGVDGAIRMQVAVGTSLATIVLTSIRSAHAHHQRGAVDGALLRAWALPILGGVIAGAAMSAVVSGRVLEAVFAIVAFVVALYMLFGYNLQLASRLPGQPVKSLIGVMVGWLSSIMGIGGGTLSVPILSMCRYPIRYAVGTASAIGLLIAVPGTLGFIIAGWNAPNLPPGNLGFVNLVGFAAIVPATLLMAPLGASTAHRIPRHALRIAFAIFLLLTAARLFAGTLSH